MTTTADRKRDVKDPDNFEDNRDVVCIFGDSNE